MIVDYGAGGITGFAVDNSFYTYRKNAQGDITHILDNTGNIVVKYVYDAWGNHIVTDSTGTVIPSDTSVIPSDSEESQSHIGNLNPFRYRSYYFDTETGLYYLQSRYYDSEVGRFINADNIDYLDPESINGLNLYSYCGNDPANNVDPDGHFAFLAVFAKIGAMVAKAVKVVGGFLKTAFTKLWGGIKSFAGKIGKGLKSLFGKKELSNNPDLFKVGKYSEIKGADGLTAHHVGQGAVMEKLVPDYDYNTAPAINVPPEGHTRKNDDGLRLSTKTKGFTRVRDVVKRDISELRRVYPDVPRSALRQLIKLNKTMYKKYW